MDVSCSCVHACSYRADRAPDHRAHPLADAYGHACADVDANALADVYTHACADVDAIASAEVCCSIRFHASSWHVETTVGTRRDECGCEGFALCIQPDADSSIANRFELTDCRADDRCAP